MRRRTMRMSIMLGLAPLLLIAMALCLPDQVWGWPRAHTVKLLVLPVPPVPPVTQLPLSPPVPLIPAVPQVPVIHPLPPVPPRP